MSDVNNIPFDIQSEIMRRLPVKSLLRFRSVSKSCKSLIDSSDFITKYTSQHQHLLVSCCYFGQDHIWIVYDDHTFPNHIVSVTLPELVKKLQYPDIVGTSHGLWCLLDVFAVNNVVVWNPSIRKAVSVILPDDVHSNLGFGVCRETGDPKIVKITECMESETCQVVVYALSTGAWRRPYSTNLPRNMIRFYSDQVVVNGFLYWLASNDRSYNLIVSFDLTTEEFGEVCLPDSCLTRWPFTLSINKLRESLVVIERYLDEDLNQVHHVWMMMEDAVPKSFTKLFTIDYHVTGFRNTGEALVEYGQVLAAYEPYSKSITNVGINGTHRSYLVYSYMETLLLL